MRLGEPARFERKTSRRQVFSTHSRRILNQLLCPILKGCVVRIQICARSGAAMPRGAFDEGIQGFALFVRANARQALVSQVLGRGARRPAIFRLARSIRTFQAPNEPDHSGGGSLTGENKQVHGCKRSRSGFRVLLLCLFKVVRRRLALLAFVRICFQPLARLITRGNR